MEYLSITPKPTKMQKFGYGNKPFCPIEINIAYSTVYMFDKTTICASEKSVWKLMGAVVVVQNLNLSFIFEMKM